MVSFRPLLGLDSSLSLQRRHLACRCLLLVLLLCKSSYSFGIDDYLLEAQQLPTVGPSLAAPVFASFAPGELDAFYVLEQKASRVRRYDLNTGTLTSFVDLPDISESAGGERGLVGFTFHPNYATNGKLFVHEYDGSNVNIIELTHESGSPTVDTGTARTILSFSHGVTGASPNSHAGGWIGFSPIDGYLYIPTGDGGAGTCDLCGSPSQDLDDLQGKLLRIDVNGDDFPEDPLRNYAIPGDNPFVAGGGEAEILYLLNR